MRLNDKNPAELRSALPQHHVALSKPFRLAATEVTVAQFRRFVEAADYRTDAERDGQGGRLRINNQEVQRPDVNWRNPNYEQSDDCPVGQVSWNDAAAFCNWLNETAGLPHVYVADAEGAVQVVPGPGCYRLPTEAEWEFACRAGTTTRYFWGDTSFDGNDYCWCLENSGHRPHPVGTKRPNAFGLFDMQGNQREWVQDRNHDAYYAHSPAVDPAGPSDGNSRVTRGNFWNLPGVYSRSAARYRNGSAVRYFYYGFRVARDVERPSDEPKHGG
jgi:formylglycine-generating enzyme required for sulfatase activity